jgi:phosphatidate cytidylyltransferase
MEERPLWDPSDSDEQVDPTEGVRLIGADEAAEALERGEVASRRGEGTPRYGDRPSSPDDTDRPTLRFPLGRDESAVDLVRPRVSAPSPMPGRDAVGAVSHRWSTSRVEPFPDEVDGDDPELVDDIDLREAADDRVAAGDGGWPGEAITAPQWRDQPLDLDLDDADLEDAPLLRDEETTVNSLDEPDERPVEVDADRATGTPDDDRTTVGVVVTEPQADDSSSGADEAVADADVEAESEPTAPVASVAPSIPPDEVAAVSAKAAASSEESPARSGAAPAGETSKGKDAVPPRDVRLAVLSGVGLAAAALGLFMLGDAAATVLVTVIAVVCSAELFSALRRGGYQPATLLGLVATGGLVAATYWRGEVAIPIVLGLTVVVALLWYLIGVTRIEPTMNAGVSVLAIGYIGLLASFAALLLRYPNGRGLLGGVIVAVVANDVCALVVGRKFGKRLVAPHVSPAKTIEGLVGGGVASVAVCVLLLGSDVGPLGLHPWTMGSAVALGIAVAVMAPLGDLCESMMKRDLGIKDMSAIIPGHGGVLDRVDALLFCLPAAYYLTLVLDLA